jgi:predicted acylesterase/phospholipase RssA
VDLSPDKTRFFQTCLGVFQGGGCRGAAFVGAVEEAELRGVTFAGVAGTSAGSIVAALLGAGANASFLQTALQGLDFVSLLREPTPIGSTPDSFLNSAGLWIARRVLSDAAKIWEYRGLHSSAGIEDWVNAQLRALLGRTRPRIRFVDLPVPTYVVATDIVSNDVKIWSSFTTPEDEVAFAVRCSCSIPAFFQPVQDRYIDGGVLSNLPVFVFSDPQFAQNKPFANRILAFTLISTRGSQIPTTGKEVFKSIVSTVVDGAGALQGRLVYPVHQIAIDTGDIQATDFSTMNSQKVTWLAQQGKHAAQQFFNDELGKVQAVQQHGNLLSGEDELYSALTDALDEVHLRHIVICDSHTRWAYALFPTLLGWRYRGARIQVALETNGAVTGHELYRRRLLLALGAELVIGRPVGFRGFLLNPEDQALARAIVISPDLPGSDDDIVAVRYYSPLDFAAIQSLWERTRVIFAATQTATPAAPTIRAVAEQLILEKLARHVKAYATTDARLSMETVQIDSMISLTKLVRGYKFKQIQQLFDLFHISQLDYFDPAEVCYSGDLTTYVTPPVVEYSGGRYILIQGNTRAVYCYRNGIREMRCIVVRNPGAPLPSNQRIEVRNVLIGGRTISTSDRYGGDLDRDYRSIEWATHRPEETLLDVKI